MDGWRPATMPDWMSDVQKELNALDRRAPVRSSWGGTRLASVDFDGGRTIDSEGTIRGPFDLEQGYIPLPGDEVVLNATGGGSFMIMGAKSNWVALPLKKAGVYVTYNNNVASEASWANPGVGLRNGFAELSGLIALTSAAAGTLLFVLPPRRRPDTSTVFVISNSDVARTLTVEADGSVRLGSGWTVNGFVALDSIIFPVAGRAQWTLIDPEGTVGSTHQFQNGWHDYIPGGGAYGRTAYWEDEYGVVWTRGMVSGGTVTDGVAMFTTDKNFYREQHVPAGSRELMGGVHAGLPGRPGTVNFKTPSANTWVSLGGVTFFTQAALLDPGWERITADYVPGQGWSQYGVATNYTTPGKWLRPDGLQFLGGLMGGGTLSPTLRVATVSDAAKRGQQRNRMFIGFSNQAYARIDVNGIQSNYGGTQSWGGIMNTGGSAVWFSWDGMKFIPGGV